ncbi:hypothetical protein BU24DRAFT_142049 [Aaosphaeria arxii CBS 175.79]|uniref:Integral membrane protein n=1 Tax=Aaosphaeria arxii CBS 175.79 TaxID=1450172 RepID=A0A6A5XUH8_9PLEO|nr:uncharacterized protein BU24DRAFT_142049 [Aaosphaeria arxii CBS 175.79]KAF2017015.1 hypothetical protein BU24DRAFT_142049 [Aaosphaeria arxii CBS 175.79]
MARVRHLGPAVRLQLARPLATAYLLGLLSSAGPRLAKVLVLLLKGKLSGRAATLQWSSILRQGTALHRFPTFCGVLIGGTTLLPAPIRALITLLLRAVRINATSSPDYVRSIDRIARFIAALVSAFVSFHLLNRKPQDGREESQIKTNLPTSHLEVLQPGPFDQPPEYGARDVEVDEETLKAKSLSRLDLAGRTMDLTMFAVVRALDVVVTSSWRRLSRHRPSSSSVAVVSRNTPPVLFSFAAATIMHAWFYAPSRLSSTYNRWISAAAELDDRLLLALRHARYGTWVYGKDTGMAPLLGSMCRDYGLPEELGDPAKTIPIPCELVHMGRSKSCEVHGMWRFYRGWLFAAKMYAPLHFIVLVRHLRAHRLAGRRICSKSISPLVLRFFTSTARASAFLGAFIAAFYYGVCSARTRFGPAIFSFKTVTPQMWDSGLCVLAGCFLCGSSILVEEPRKQLEIVFFVLPRALATWFPRRYLPENRWKEHAAFALSSAIVLTAAQEDPKNIHGVIGKLLHALTKTA